MSRRYDQEVTDRALVIASNAADVGDFDVPHAHEPGECVECDAQRLLVKLSHNGFSLHKIRRTFGGHGGEPDPLR